MVKMYHFALFLAIIFFVYRWRIRPVVCWNPQFSIQVGPPIGPALNVPRQAWLGSGKIWFSSALIYFDNLKFFIILIIVARKMG
jgi:hypothetical protein